MSESPIQQETPKNISQNRKFPEIKKHQKIFHTALLSAIILHSQTASAQELKAQPAQHDEKQLHKHSEDHKDHDHNWEGSAAVTLFPAEPKKAGTDIHLARIIGDHKKVHFEVIVTDLGFSYEQIPLQGNLIGQRPGVDRYEFHLGAGVGVGLPIGDRFEFSISQGIGLGLNYYPFQNLGFTNESKKQLMNFNETFEFTPVYQMHFEFSFSVTENFLITTGFAPHITLTPVFHEIEAHPGKQKKELHADLPITFGIGIEL